MDYKELLFLWNADCYRYKGKWMEANHIHVIQRRSYRIIFLFRLCKYLKAKNMILYLPVYFMYRFVCAFYNVDLPVVTDAGPGLYMFHCYGIVINGDTIIGSNCNISHGVSIGKASRGKRIGTATIGNNVYLGPGAKIEGRVHIGDHAVIGANAVVVEDVPEKAVLANPKAIVLNFTGSDAYVLNPIIPEL
ncbi:serine acetyltransferase [Candidatus Cloacimonadaceae bacterium]